MCKCYKEKKDKNNNFGVVLMCVGLNWDILISKVFFCIDVDKGR